MKFCQRSISLLLVLLITLSLLPQLSFKAEAATTLPNDIYLKQQTSVTCTLASATMMLRARMYLSENADWEKITESALRSTAWIDGKGSNWKFTYTLNGNTMTTGYKFVSGISVSDLKAVLDNHPEGILLYSDNKRHAVFLTDYEGDTFYCADPASSYSGKRIPLKDSYLAVKCGGGQAAVLKNVTLYSYISNYSIKKTGYLGKCTPYPSSGKIKITASTTFKALPCSKTTDPESVDIYTPAKNSTWAVTGIYKNTYGNYWYETKYNGKTCYVYSKNVEFSSPDYGTVTISSVTAPSSIKTGESFSIKGLISSAKLPLAAVRARVYNGTSTSGTVALTSTDSTISGSNYQLYKSDVDTGLKFGSLSAGSYTYEVVASVKNYHANGNTLNYIDTKTFDLRKSTFTVSSSTTSGSGTSSTDTCTCSTIHAGNYICTTTSTNLYIRNGHGTSYSAIGNIPAGATVYVSKASGTSSSDWAHVEYNGVSGYASMGYLKSAVEPDYDWWMSKAALGAKISSATQGDTVYFCYRAYDENTGEYLSEVFGDDFKVSLSVTAPDGTQVYSDSSSADLSWFALPCEQAGSYTFTISLSYGNTTSFSAHSLKVTANPKQIVVDKDAINLVLGSNEETTIMVSKIGYHNNPTYLSFGANSKLSCKYGEWIDDYIPLTVRALAEGSTTLTLYLRDNVTDEVLDFYPIYVTIGKSVNIDGQPTSVVVSKGATAKTTVYATGDGLKYQWYYTSNGNTSTFMKSSNTTATYSTTIDASRAGRKVYCVITDKYGNTVKTNTVTLGMKVSIAKQPTSVVTSNGATAATTVTAQGEGLKYQWYYTSGGNSNTFMKSSITSATYFTTMGSSKAGRKVYCMITDKYGNTVITNTVTLGMNVNVTKQPTAVAVINGATATTSVTATGEGLKYQWYYTSGSNSNTFMKSSITSATYFTTMDASKAGRKVYCVITDKYGNSATTKTVTLGMKAQISRQPASTVVNNGATAKAIVTATGEGLKYQWYFTSNGATSEFMKSSNTTATYSTTMDATRAGRKVYCVITDKYGNTVTTKTVTLGMRVSITKQPVSVTVVNGKTAKTAVTAVGEGLKYQWYFTSNGNTSEFMKSSNTTATYSTTMDASRAGRKAYCMITDKYGNTIKTNTVTLRTS